MFYSQEQIDRANQVNLEDFLRTQGETLTRSGKEYRWKCHDSLTVRGNKWFRHSQSKGGYPVDFVMEFYGKSFPEAVRMLISEEGTGVQEARPAPPPDFRLPLRNLSNTKVLDYLTKQRRIAPAIVEHFIASGDLYEEASHHNAVFVGRDKTGLPRYAHCRGTADRFRLDVAGSDKSYGFCHQGEGGQLFVFEAPIDLLSFLCLYPKDWKSRSYLSLGGVSGKALERFLSEHPDIQQVFLCLDSDTAGCDACKRLTESPPDRLTVIRLLPARKDWNEVLQHREEIPNQKFIAETVTLQEAKTEPPVPMIRMSQVEETAEDGLGDTVKPRLQEAGADLDRVLVIDDGDQPLTLSDERLEKAICQNGAKLLIIDPVQAFLGANVDMNRANEVRPIFRRLGDVAQNTGCAILLIGHLNKAAAELGISARTVRQAKQRLGKKLHSERSSTQWILSLKNKAQRVDDAAGLPLRYLQIPCAAKRCRRTGAPSGGCWINI